LANLEMNPLRLHVTATAGNGKTLVARHFYTAALQQGKRPLLLCFNRPLAERLKHLVDPGGRVDTWYGFCDQFLQTRGLLLDFGVMRSSPDFWEDALRQLEAQALADTPSGDWHFDTLVVDEAQDFEDAWFQALRLFLPDAADVLWLEDPKPERSRRRPTRAAGAGVRRLPVVAQLPFSGLDRRGDPAGTAGIRVRRRQ
jgi:hypothetical protein